MKILLCAPNIRCGTGGGETVYREIIRQFPKHTFFLLEDPPKSRQDFENVVFLGKRKRMKVTKVFENSNLHPSWSRYALSKDSWNSHKAAIETAYEIAYKVQGMEFDVIDVPDYLVTGEYLRLFLQRNRVSFKQITCFLHGALSLTLMYERAAHDLSALKTLENDQIKSSDFFLGLGDWYLKRINKGFGESHSIDPVKILIQDTGITAPKIQTSKSRIFIIGREENRKGFLSVPHLLLFGSENLTFQELLMPTTFEPSRQFVENMKRSASTRHLDFKTYRVQDQNELFQEITENDLLVIPSKFDAFNLVALEGLARGKAVAVSNQCGVVYHLRKNYPHLLFFSFDPKNELSFLSCLKQFEKYRKKNIHLYLERNVRIISNSKKMQLKDPFAMQQPLSTLRRPTSANVQKSYEFKSRSRMWILVKKILNEMKNVEKKRVAQKIRLSSKIGLLIVSLLAHGDKKVIREKLKPLFLLPKLSLPVPESEKRNIIETCYAWRVYRLTRGGRNASTAKAIVSRLHDMKLREEATVITLLEEGNQKEVFQYLDNRYQKLRSLPKIDAKITSHYKVNYLEGSYKTAIIVSCYNGEEKLEKFLKLLSVQDDIKNGTAYVVLIDANSSKNEAKMALELCQRLKIPYFGMRTSRRITIQDAWNLGIVKSKSDYLCFLGVDEALYPGALSFMRENLDANPDYDWCIGNSVVTEVDKYGTYQKDIMTYDRRNAQPVSYLLETCYVSYVGAMYRRAVHAKHGYYDPSFSGAGDTEFKNRVLPFLNVLFLDKTLGYFLNYPESRTTASPKIELEDIRAWHVFRSPGGLLYSLRDSEENAKLLSEMTKGYRKSFCLHTSTDIELFVNLMQAFSPLPTRNSSYQRSKKIFERNARFVDSFIYRKDPKYLVYLLLEFNYKMWYLGFGIRRKSTIQNDNLFEQYNWLW